MCPVCGATHPQTAAWVKSSVPAELKPPPRPGDFLQGYDGIRSFFTYFKCGSCGALFCPTYFTQAQLDQLYREQPENMEEVSFDARRKTQEGYFEILKPHSRMAGGYLEIGCDMGLLAEVFARQGKFGQFWLYEPNLSVHKEIETRLAGHEYRIRTENFVDSEIPAGSMSTATIVHVLDHILDPYRLLLSIHDSLEVGGVMMSVTHDADSLLARVLGRRFPPFCYQHPQLYSPRTIRTLYERAGFEVVDIIRTWNYFPLFVTIDAGLKIFGSGFANLNGWSGPLIGFKIGNIAVVAKKTSKAGPA